MKVVLNLTGDSQNWLRHARVLATVLKPILETQVVINQLYLQTHKVPPLYRAGVRYSEEPLSLLRLGWGYGLPEAVEEFACVPAVVERGAGDSDDLVPWRVAELRNAGERARIRLEPRVSPHTGEKTLAILVLRQNGEVEDPSEKLGMPPTGSRPKASGGVRKIVMNLSGERSRWLGDSRALALAIKPILDTQSGINQLYLQMHKVPPLYRAGVRYSEEPVNILRMGWTGGNKQAVEEFACIPAIMERGCDDCDGLGPWRNAELRNAGEKSHIRVTWKQHPVTKQKVFHVVVRRQNGTVDDPSAKLGMPTGAPERQLGIA